MSRSYQRGRTARDAGSGIGRAFILAVTFFARAIIWLTKPPGSAIMLSFGVLYFAGISCEGYWQAMNASAPAFMPKPFINDGANPIVFLRAIVTPTFWFAAAVSLVIQGIQAFVLREVEVARAKAEYEAVAVYQVPEPDEDAIDLAEHRRQQYKNAGMRTIRMRGFLIALTYAVDLCIAAWNYPLLGQAITQFAINLVWCIASIIGTEAMINLFWEAIAPLNKHPQVEVLD